MLISNFTLNNSALILIEFQNEWISAHGKLHHLFTKTANFSESLKNAECVLRECRKCNIPIIHAGLKFSADYKELGKGKHGVRAAIPIHQTFQENTEGSQFAAPFSPKTNEFVVSGRTGASIFAGSNLDHYLRNNQITTLYLMGYALHVCVESTLRAAHDLGYETIIIEDACAAFTQAQKDYVLHEVIHHFGASISTHDFLAHF